jgi:hypothetical protein
VRECQSWAMRESLQLVIWELLESEKGDHLISLFPYEALLQPSLHQPRRYVSLCSVAHSQLE